MKKQYLIRFQMKNMKLMLMITNIFKNYKVRATDINSSIENGYISYKFSKYKRNKRLVFEQYSKSTTFLTTINNRKKQNLTDISFSNNILKFNCDEKNFSIEL